ncbi:MAG: PKD domain-containing protein [Burkholderiales bacterium]|nr:PKD domain-containing protein [Burkholderiales bacterium]
MKKEWMTALQSAAGLLGLRRAIGVCLLATLAACGGSPAEVPTAGGVTYVKNFGMPGADHLVTASAALPDGGLALLGMVEVAGDSATGTAGSTRLAVSRIDPQGNLLWSQTYGSEPFIDRLAVRTMLDVAPAGDGGVFVAGQSAAGPVVAKYDVAGNLVNTQLYGSARGTPGDVLAEIRAMAAAPTGGYVIGGRKLRDAEGVLRNHAWLQYAGTDGTPAQQSNDFDGLIHDSPQYTTSTFNYEAINDLVISRDARRPDLASDPSIFIGVTGSRHEGRLMADDVQTSGVWVAEYALGRDSSSGEVPPANEFQPTFSSTTATVDQNGSGQAIAAIAPDTYLAVGGRSAPSGLDGGAPFARQVARGLSTSGDELWSERLGVRQGSYSAVIADQRVAGDAVAIISYSESAPERELAFLRLAGSGSGFDRLSTLRLDDASYMPMHDDPSQSLAARHGIGALTVWALAQMADGQFAIGGAALSTANGRWKAWVGLLDHGTHRVRSSRWLDDARCDQFAVTRLRNHGDGGLLAVAPTCLYKLDSAANVQSVLPAAGLVPTTTARARAIRALPDGGFLVGAVVQGGSWLLKLDEAGAIRWQRRLPGVNLTDLELAGDNLPGSADTGFVVAAWGPEAAGQILTRFDPDANVLWQRSYSGLAVEHVRRMADGGFVMASDGRITRVDANGQPVWVRTLNASINDLRSTRDGGFVLAGRELTRLDAAGAVRWHVRPEPDRAADGGRPLWHAVRETADGGFVAVGDMQRPGQSYCYPSAGGNRSLRGRELALEGGDERRLYCLDTVVVSLAADGSLRASKRFGTGSDDGGTSSIHIAPDNGLLITTTTDGYDFPHVSAFVLRLSADLDVAAGCPAGLDEVVTMRSVETTATSTAAALPVPVPGTQAVEETAFESTSVTAQMVTARSCSAVSNSPVLSITATGAGLVSSTPAGLACGNDGAPRTACAQAWASGTVVTLAAAAQPQASFVGWGGACAAFGSASAASITLRSDLTCSAAFSVTSANPPPMAAFFVTTPTPTAGAAVNFDASASSDDTGIVEYAWDFEDDGTFDVVGTPADAKAAVNVYANPGSYRVRLRVTDGAGGTAQAVQTLTVAPAGVPGGVVLTLVVDGISFHGVVGLTPERFACIAGSTCTYADYPVGTRVMLEATPYSGSTFGGWTGCDSVEGRVCWVDMTGSRTVTARING